MPLSAHSSIATMSARSRVLKLSAPFIGNAQVPAAVGVAPTPLAPMCEWLAAK
jgi:hypothetical protein